MSEANSIEGKVRYHALDILRGISIIYIVFYHAVFNISLYSIKTAVFLNSNVMVYSRTFFVAILILISGISCYLTKSNIKRGIKTFLAALLVTAVTAIVMPKMTIIFGILHFFGVAMLIFAALKKPLEKIPWYIALPILLILYILTYDIYDIVGRVPESYVLFSLGFNTGHISGDYYPIFPHIFLFLSGTVIGRSFAKRQAPKIFEKNFAPPLAYIGKHTLIIYLAHHPILFGITYLVFMLIGK